MFFYSRTVAVILLLILLEVTCHEFPDECVRLLNVSNDGPVTLDVPVTVYAQIKCPGDDNERYLFEFKSDVGQEAEVFGNGTEASASFIFTKNPGNHTVRVQAHLIHPLRVNKMASGETSFEVKEYIPGAINVLGSVKDRNDQEYIGTGWETSIAVEIFYPPQVLLDAEFAYSWSIGEERFTNDRSVVQYRFQEPGLKLIRVDIVGRISSYHNPNHVHYKWGHFDKEITVKNPFFNVNISGNTYLEHGQLLDLDISCNGSGPVDYCWKLLPSSESDLTNLSCSDPANSPECSFSILYYFRNSGDFHLAIYVSNLVSSMQRNVEVHIYDVSLRPQLSTVIIPVVCSILVVVIIAVAVIIQMRRRSVTNVETADFDFMTMDEPNAVAVETSWEIMWRSIVQLLQLRCLLCNSSNTVDTAHYGTILKER